MRLYLRISLSIAIVSLGVGIASALLAGRILHNSMFVELQDKALIICQTTVEHIIHNVTQGEAVITYETLMELRQRTKGLEYAYVVGFDGKIFAHTFDSGFPKALLDENHKHFFEHTPDTGPTLNEYQTVDGKAFIDQSLPLIKGLNAHLHIGMNVGHAYENIAVLRTQILELTFVIVFLGIAIGIIVSRRITMPLTRLANFMRAYGKGEGKDLVELKGGGLEIDELTHAFQKMIGDRRLKERFQEKLLNDMLTFVAVLDPNGEVIFVNNTPLKVGGLELEDVIGKKFFDAPWWTHSAEVRDMIIGDIEQCASGETLVHDVPIRTADGSLMWIEYSMHPIFDEQGMVQYLIPEGRDISERKKLEIGLRESEAQFRRLVEKSPDILYRYSDRRGGTYYSPRVEDVFGYTPECLLEHPSLWHDSIHPDDLPRVDAAIAGLFLGKGFDIEYRIRDARGEWHWLHDRTIDIRLKDKEAIVEGLASDITERKQAEEALRGNEAQLRTLIETLPDLVWLKDPDGVYLACNPKLERLFGAKETEIVGKTDYDFVDKELADFFREKDKAAMVAGKPILNEEEITYADDGHTEMLETIKTPMLDRDGKLIGVLGVGHDITNRKKVETAIRKSKEEWEKTFNAMSDIITIQDKDMRIVRANKAAYDFFEVDYGDLVGKYCHEVFTSISEPCPKCPVLNTLETIQCHSGIIQHEKLGKIFHISSAPILGENNEIEFLVHIAKDITEQKRLEEELFQAHKMEAIGTLAGGIAHDFNNILTAIISFAHLAKRDLVEDSSAGKDIDVVIQSSRRAADLVQQILTFSRKSEHNLQSLNPHLIATESLRMLHSSLPSTIIIHEDIDKGCGKIWADPTNIHQIMMNLCTNALHAMEKEKGTLTVKLYRREVAAEEIVYESGVTAGLFIVLSVSDTGHGMDAVTKERIFEPYFTTKEMGKGTGMGLAVIHGIIHDYKGFIKVDSTPGEGSTFSVYIPALQEEATSLEDSASKESENEVPLPTGNERILVVDDEPILVRAHKRQLTRLGYRVTVTTDSKDALEKIHSHPEEFDLLITDQTMPGLSGVELAAAVHKIKPDIPIILCTGHSDVVTKEDALAMGIKKYVSKPIYRDELSQAIREVLDEK